MSIICCECGSTNVLCEAIINPNTKDIIEYTDESFDGWCVDCKECQALTDTEKVKSDIDNAFNDFKSVHNTEPLYATCRVYLTGSDCPVETAIIKLSANRGDADKQIFLYCKDIEGLKSLAEFTKNDFVIIEFIAFNEN